MSGAQHSRQHGGTTAAVLALGPAIIIVFTCLVLPLATLLRYSFNRFSPQQLMVETFTLENYRRFFLEPYYQDVMLTTFGLAVVCTLSSVALGFPVAYQLARTKSRLKSVIIIAILFPLLVGNVVRAAGWMAFLGRQGLLNFILVDLGVTESPIEFMYTPVAVYFGLLSVMLPFMILTLQGVLESVDFTLVDAAKNLGASPRIAFLQVVLPLSLPGIAAGSVLVFTLAMNAYATPFLLGGPSFKMMAPALYQQVALVSNWPFGAALAFILIAATAAATTLSTAVLSNQYRARSA